MNEAPPQNNQKEDVVSAEEKMKSVRKQMITAFVERQSHFYINEGGASFAVYLEQKTIPEDAEEHEQKGLLSNVASECNDDHHMSYDDLANRVDMLYKQGGGKAVGEYLSELIDTLPIDTSENNDIISCNIVSKLKYMESLGYDSEGTFMEIHFDSLYKHGEKNIRSAIKDELGRVAKDIVENHPDVQAVVATSWLMGTGLAERFGFTVLEDVEVIQEGHQLRGQLITQDGSVHEDRRKAYIEGKDLPFKVKCGYISVDDFLARYLPKDKTKESE